MISVLIVNHDGGEHLFTCLRRLEELSGDWHEVIVADNASTDGSRQRVAREMPWVRLLELGKNPGFGTANNRAAEVAEGDRLLLLNSDAWPEPGCLPRLEAALDADPRLGAVAPELRYPDGRRQFCRAPTTGIVGEAIQKLRNPFEAAGWVHRLRPPFDPGWLTAACLMLRRRAFDQVGGFDEGYFLYYEDVDLCLRLRRAGWRIDDVPEATAVHVKGGSRPGDAPAAERVAGSVAYRRSQLRYYATHRPAWENAVLRWRLRRKFGHVEDPERRAELLALLAEAS